LTHNDFRATALASAAIGQAWQAGQAGRRLGGPGHDNQTFLSSFPPRSTWNIGGCGCAATLTRTYGGTY